MRLVHDVLRTIHSTWLAIRRRHPRRRTAAGPRRTALSVTGLEPRENPAAPAGLADVPLLISGYPMSIWSSPVTYDETHTIIRNESNTVTVDQSGTGSAGTFTIDVVGSSYADDTVGGTGSGSNGSVNGSITTSGTGTTQFTWHAVISGEYAYGVFTITSQTYEETGSYSSSQDATLTYTFAQGGSATFEWDANNSGNYTLSWSATADANGELAFTSYSYSSTGSAHWHTHSSNTATPTYSDATYDTSSWVTTSWAGSETVSYAGSRSWDEYRDTYSPPNHDIYDYSFTDPFSGTEALSPGLLYEPTSLWQWQAAGYDAENFTFHGDAAENSSLTESATYHVVGDGSSFDIDLDVDAFSSTYHSSDSGHAVDDLPGVPESGTGTDLFHRDTTVTYANDVTGSGSYVGGYANADFHAVENASFALAHSYTSTGEYETGFDEDDEPYELEFNFETDTNGDGNVTITRDYHDAGPGLALTGESFSDSGSITHTSGTWGARNGVAFNEQWVTPESWGSSFSLSGDPAPVDVPDGMEEAYPLTGMKTGPQVFFVGQWSPAPTPRLSPVRGKAGSVQDWYNKKVIEIGKKAEAKVVTMSLQKQVMQDVAVVTKAGGTFTLEEGGYIVASRLGYEKQLDKEYAKWVKNLKAQGYTDIEMKPTKLVGQYAIDMTPSPNPAKKRSGNYVVEFKVTWRFSVKTKNGATITVERPSDVRGLVQLHDPKLETMDLQP